MKRKADEFCAMQQESMSVEEYTYQFMELARYAPEEVDKDEKKQDMFKKGLSQNSGPCLPLKYTRTSIL